MRWTSGRRAPWLLFVLCFLGYNANLRGIASFDSLAAGVLPFQIWRGEGLRLDRYAALPPEVRYAIAPTADGSWQSAYPIVTPLLVLPLYLPAAFFPEFSYDSGIWQPLMEKLSASVLASLAVVFLFLALCRLTSTGRAFLTTLLFAFATSTWTTSSQALWQHGAAEMLLAGSLALLFAPKLGVSGLLALGLGAGLIAANRPIDVFFSAALGVAVLVRWGRGAWPFWMASGAVAIALLTYNLRLFGSPVGGYGVIPGLEFRAFSFEALLGLLVGTRGLLVYCPFLLALAWARGLPPPLRSTGWILAGGWTFWFLAYCCFTNWEGGYCYGPRYMTDGLPILFCFLTRAFESPAGGLKRVAFTGAVVAAVFFQVVGAFCYPSGNSGAGLGIWHWAGFSPVAALAGGLATPSFAPLLRPSLAERPPFTRGRETRGTAEYEEAPPTAARPAEYLPFVIRLDNRSSRTWSSVGGWRGLHSVRWVVRMSPVDAPGLVIAQPDYWLAFRLAPRESLRQKLWIRGPGAPGRWLLEIEPAHRTDQGMEPFSKHSFEPLRAVIEVGAD